MPESDVPVPLPLSDLCAHTGPQQQQSELSLTASASPSSVLPGFWKLLPKVLCILILALDGGQQLAFCYTALSPRKESLQPLLEGDWMTTRVMIDLVAKGIIIPGTARN
jgi:hypothetical protein